jgi:mono/diheme cytochrome c family protein
MRLIASASACLLIVAAVALYDADMSSVQIAPALSAAPQPDGQQIFRFDTFGDEQLWTDVLRMHEVVEKVSPAAALQLGLKVDVDALPESVQAAIKTNAVDLNAPATTLVLLRQDAIVGVKATVTDGGRITKLGITCALCHSTVDNSLSAGIGHRLDGWANADLDVGAIVALSDALDDNTKAEFRMWGPGKYDPRHHYFNGTSIIPLNSPSLPVVIPPIYGLKHVGYETYTGDGPISYWNSYVGIGQMGGQGTFNDSRVGVFITQQPDLVTPKLAALLDYQLRLQAPEPPASSVDRDAARRGRALFRDEARCSGCHREPALTDVRSGRKGDEPYLHSPAETGMEPEYAARSATGRYRTTPLRGLLQHPPYFHDGSAPDLRAVVEHYDQHFALGLTDSEKADLVEYLKTL